jgi:glycosyltransferase involved in cell wall biosynthesis
VKPIRLTVVMTHPVQYLAPWFRNVAAHHPELALTVVYATAPTDAQQGVGFARAFQWDASLIDGYAHAFARAARPGDHVGSDRFLGLDAPEIVAAVRATRPEVALVPGWHAAVLARALLACRFDGVPLLYRGDSTLESGPTGLRRVAWAVRTAALLHLYRGHLAVGARARAYLRAFGVPPWRIFDAPHAVDNARFAADAAPHQTPDGRRAARAAFGLDDGDFAVLFVGKLEPKKRIGDLIAAVARLRGTALVIVGSGADEPEARALAARLGARVRFAGFLNQGELGRAYAAADCLALPSDGRETWGLVVNEAMATGLPCVVSDRVGCAPDLITPQTGATFPLGNVGALAAALAHIAEQRRRHDYVVACRARASLGSLEAAARGLVDAALAVIRQ